MPKIKGVVISQYCADLVSRLCDGEITKEQFDEDIKEGFPPPAPLFDYALGSAATAATIFKKHPLTSRRRAVAKAIKMDIPNIIRVSTN